MKNKYKIFFWCLFLSFKFSSSPHWLIEIDCDKSLNFFELRTFNAYNLLNCDKTKNICGEYINLMFYSIFNNEDALIDYCEIGNRKIKYSLKPVNMSGSKYDTTPHFLLDLSIDNRLVVKEVPLFPSPVYAKELWGLKLSSIRFNNNMGSIEIFISDDELYQESNSNKMNSLTFWLWDSNYMSAFDPKWEMNWKSINEQDVWSKDNFIQPIRYED